MFNSFLQAFLTWSLSVPVSVPKRLCYRFLTPAAARLFEVGSGAEEPGEGHVRTALSRAVAKARDHSKYLARQHEGRGTDRTGSCSKWLRRVHVSCWLLWERRSPGGGSEGGGILKLAGVLAASISLQPPRDVRECRAQCHVEKEACSYFQ